jgi:hypothetical protein
MVRAALFAVAALSGVLFVVEWPRLAAQASHAWDWVDRNNIKGAVVAAAAAIIVFVLTRVADLAIRWRDRIIMRRRLVVGLYNEIESNLAEINLFVASSDAARLVAGRLREDAERRAARRQEGVEDDEPVFRPLIVITESSRFFNANAALTPELKRQVLVPLMEFYRALEELDRRQAAFESKAFETISVEARISTVADLWNTGSDAKTFGEAALTAFRETYPDAWFSDLEEAKRAMPQPGRIELGG